MGKFSRDKGKRGERAWAAVCREHGFTDARRSAQFSGKEGRASDVEGLPGIHQEVKWVEHLNLRDAMAQSLRDATAEGRGRLPIVAHKKNECGWLVTMTADDWFRLYAAYFEELCEKQREEDE